MTIDVPHAGDSVIRRDNVPILIVDARLAQTLASRVLDFPAQSTVRRGFTLGWRSVAEDAERAGQSDGSKP